MKHMLLVSAAIVILLACVPFPGQDAADLEPLEILYLSVGESGCCFRTDTGDEGTGNCVAAALEDLRRHASGEIFLETADYLLLEPGAQSCLAALWDVLRPGCRICLAEGEPDLEQLSAFLHTHEPKLTLLEYRAGVRRLPVLRSEGGKVCLEQ